MKSLIGDVATAALDTLQRARKLPVEQAVERLHDFLQTMNSSGGEGDRLADASSALSALINDLQQKGAADNDAWQHAVETMVSLVNEAN